VVQLAAASRDEHGLDEVWVHSGQVQRDIAAETDADDVGFPVLECVAIRSARRAAYVRGEKPMLQDASRPWLGRSGMSRWCAARWGVTKLYSRCEEKPL
jgi:hypothetical protein